jgi:hypothetical protein
MNSGTLPGRERLACAALGGVRLTLPPFPLRARRRAAITRGGPPPARRRTATPSERPGRPRARRRGTPRAEAPSPAGPPTRGALPGSAQREGRHVHGAAGSVAHEPTPWAEPEAVRNRSARSQDTITPARKMLNGSRGPSRARSESASAASGTTQTPRTERVAGRAPIRRTAPRRPATHLSGGPYRSAPSAGAGWPSCAPAKRKKRSQASAEFGGAASCGGRRKALDGAPPGGSTEKRASRAYLLGAVPTCLATVHTCSAGAIPARRRSAYSPVRVRHEVADVAVLRPRDGLTAPAVLPAVSYRDVRPW